jgi:site-specific recombinase XerC
MQKPIRKLPIRRRGDKWILDLRKLPRSRWPEGCRSGRVTFDTKAAAEGAATLALADHDAAVNLDFDITPAHRAAAVEAFRVMEGYSLGELADAAREYVKRHDPNAPKKTCREIYEEYLEAKKGAGVSEITLRNSRQYLGRWVGDAGDKPAHEVETVDLERWMDSQPRPITGEHRKNFRRLFRSFFKFAVDRKYIRHNSAQGIQQVRGARRMPGIISAGDLRRLLDAASQYSAGVMLPYFVLCALAGLRPSEARRVDWASINLDKSEVYLSPEVVGKTYADRFVHLQPNAVAWLSLIPVKARRGRIHWTRRHYAAVRDLAGDSLSAKMKATKDILRHSSASHLYAMTRSTDQVTANHGHDIRIFLKHYRATVSQDEGTRYFNVMPGGSEGAVIPMMKAAAT